MTPSNFSPNAPGDLVTIASISGNPAWAFVPHALPPDLEADHEIADAIGRATLALGNLNGVGQMLRNPDLLIRPFVQREALASSRIEGTKADYDQLIRLEARADEPEIIDDPDLQEVTNYVETLFTGWHREPECPFSTGFLMQLHQQLLSGVRGSDKQPGRLREVQVFIGSNRDNAASARFVPPPPERVRGLLDDLCTYIVENRRYASLIRIALIHYQFETVHPFMDGNGRLGRLLIPLSLGLWNELDMPLLYLSEYLEDHRDEYIDRLYAVSTRGDWKGWILFLLDAIEQQSRDSFIRIRELNRLRESLRERYQGESSPRLLIVIDHLFDRPSLTVRSTARLLEVTVPTATRIVERLVNDGVLQEITGKRRDRVYVAQDIVNVMFARTPTR
ncbi:MAG: Fic/DOC family N-terminal domain-containing protein [Thermomicrobiales bacterium]